MTTSQLPDRVACYRHADHLTGVHCTRCGRPICPDCMAPAPVGHHCPTCVREDSARAGATSRVRWPGPGGLSGRGGPRRLTPVVTTLAAVNMAIFILTSLHPLWRFDYAQNPFLVAHGQAFRLLTSMFVHENLAHVGFNMAALLIMGPPIENALGRNRFLALYLLSGLGGAVISFAFGPVSVYALGASGAIFGIFGAWFSLARAQRADTAVIVFLIAINLAYSFWDPAIDWRAHVGGLVTGMVVGAAFAWAGARPARVRVVAESAMALGLLAVLGLTVLVRSAQI
jgi:membrane associated rhomboid family serine protease